MTSRLRVLLLVLVVAALGGVLLWLSADTAVAPSSVVAPATPWATPGATADGGLNDTELRAAATGPDPLGVTKAPTELKVLSAKDNLAVGDITATEPVPYATLRGHVTDALGRPIAGAQIALVTSLTPEGRNLVQHVPEAPDALGAAGAETLGSPDSLESLADGQVLTGASGQFALRTELSETTAWDSAIPPMFVSSLGARPQLLVSYSGFAVLSHELPGLAEGESDVGTLVLQPAGGFLGRVLDPDGRPFADVALSVRPSNSGMGGIGGLVSQLSGSAADAMAMGKSGADGRFSLTQLAVERVDLSLKGQGFPLLQLLDLDVLVGAPQNLGDLQLQRGASLGGVVLDENQVPMGAATVTAKGPAAEGLESVRQVSARLALGAVEFATKTDGAGRFTISGLTPGDYHVSAVMLGHSKASQDDVSTGTTDLTLVTSAMGQLLITVRAAGTGELIRDADIEAEELNAAGDTADDLVVLTGEPLQELRSLEAVQDGAWLPLPADLTGVSLVQGAGHLGTRLELSAPGFARLVIQQQPLLSVERQPLVLQLVAESRLAGTVRDGSGDVVKDVTVTATRPEAGMQIPVSSSTAWVQSGSGLELQTEEEIVAAKTDAAGHFELRGLSAGAWKLRASGADYVKSKAVDVQLAEGERRDDLQLGVLRGGTIVGTVFEADGRPATDGQLTVVLLDATPVDFRGDREAALTAELTLAFTGQGENRRHLSISGQGRFVARGLLPGAYSVTLERGSPGLVDLNTLFGAAPQSSADPERTRAVQVSAGAESEVSFTREARTGLTVRVALGQSPARAGRVSLKKKSTGFLSGLMPGGDQQLSLGAKGEAHFDQLEPGSYTVQVGVPGVHRLETAEVDLIAGQQQQLELSFRGSTISGRVTDEATGAPIPGVEISLEQQGGSEADGKSSAGRLKTTGTVTYSVSVNGAKLSGSGDSGLYGLSPEKTLSDSSGEFQLTFVEPGRWVVSAGGGDWLKGDAAALDVSAGGGSQNVAISLRRGAWIVGQVIDGDSEEPLHDVTVQLIPQGEGTKASKRKVSSDNGAYRFAAVPAGDYVLLIESQDNASPLARRTVTVYETGVEYTVHLVTSP